MSLFFTPLDRRSATATISRSPQSHSSIISPSQKCPSRPLNHPSPTRTAFLTVPVPESRITPIRHRSPPPVPPKPHYLLPTSCTVEEQGRDPLEGSPIAAFDSGFFCWAIYDVDEPMNYRMLSPSASRRLEDFEDTFPDLSVFEHDEFPRDVSPPPEEVVVETTYYTSHGRLHAAQKPSLTINIPSLESERDGGRPDTPFSSSRSSGSDWSRCSVHSRSTSTSSVDSIASTTGSLYSDQLESPKSTRSSLSARSRRVCQIVQSPDREDVLWKDQYAARLWNPETSAMNLEAKTAPLIRAASFDRKPPIPGFDEQLLGARSLVEVNGRMTQLRRKASRRGTTTA